MIAYFVANIDSYSGAAQQALLLAKSLKMNILFFNYNNKGYKKYAYNKLIKVIDLPENRFIQLLIIFWFTLKYRIKIYHFHVFFITGLFCGKILQRKMILKTTLLGDDDFDTLSSKKYWKIKYFLLKSIYMNIVLSEKMKRINSKYIDFLKIKIIPNGVLVPNRCPLIDEKENIFCFVGIVCPRKRVYESIKYFIDNYSKNTSSKMYVIGPYNNIRHNGEFSDEYVNKCFEFVKSNKLENRIIFTNFMDKENVIKILTKSKALLFFSEREGMPNVVLEAMANNCVPIVSEKNEVVREIFENGKHGFILDENFKKIKIEEIDELIKIRAPYILVNNKFNINIISLLYKRIYEV